MTTDNMEADDYEIKRKKIEYVPPQAKRKQNDQHIAHFGGSLFEIDKKETKHTIISFASINVVIILQHMFDHVVE